METLLKRRTKDLTPKQHDIVNYLSTHGAMIRDKLEEGLNIPHTTLYDNLTRLEKKKIVLRFSKPNNKKGRSPVYWQIKQAHDLVLFKVHGLVLFTKQTQDLVDKPKKNKKTLRYGKLPNIEKEILLDEVKHLTYILNKTEDSNITKQKKTINNKSTDSYILTNKNSKLTKFVLDEINKSTYFKTPTLSNQYVNKILKIRYTNIKEGVRRSTSVKIGWIVRELCNLGIIIKYSKSSTSVWKNLYKDELHAILDKKMELNYFMLKMKKEK